MEHKKHIYQCQRSMRGVKGVVERARVVLIAGYRACVVLIGSRLPRGVVGICTTPVVHSLYPDKASFLIANHSGVHRCGQGPVASFAY